MENKNFTFADYLEQLANRTTNERILQEIVLIQSHTANLRTMRRHFKQYETLKSLFDNGVNFF